MQSTKNILGMTLAFTACLGNLPAWSAEPAASESKPPTANSASGLSLRHRTASDAEQLSEEGMLTDLRDTRLCLTQMKQQATNLFLEATRTRVTVAEQPLEQSPSVINASMINEKAGYIAPRREWLVLYMNTLEPLVHLLTEDIQDVDTNERKVSAAIEDRVNPLWKTWRATVIDINKSLDSVQESIGEESGGNLALARAAVNIFEKAEELEKIRYRVALIFREEYIKAKNTKPKTGTQG